MPKSKGRQPKVVTAKDNAQKSNKKRIVGNKKVADINAVDRFSPDVNVGLNDEQVADRIACGLVNVDKSKSGKSIWQIIFGNLVTFFNIIYAVISIALIYFHEYKQLTFLFVVVANTLIAIVQEIRSKVALDKLNLISLPKVDVIRNGVTSTVKVDEVVLDDVLSYNAGNQICADCLVLSNFVEVNESMLTGESDNVLKQVGDTLYAGTYVVSGSCTAQAVKVGKYNFIQSFTAKVRKYKKPQSQLLKSFNIILYTIAILIIPIGIFLWKVNAAASSDFITTLQKTSGPIIAIIPAGPFLLTSVTLAISVVRLAKNKTMVQELYCIEMLARVDTLCLDKTGTITDGTMRVIECIDFIEDAKLTTKDIIGALEYNLNDNNMTTVALKNFFGMPKHKKLAANAVLPFSSKRKFSAVSFDDVGTYFLGAPEFILGKISQKVNELVKKYADDGYRVLLLAHSPSNIFIDANNQPQLPTVRRAVSLIVIEDHIRDNVSDTLKWFSDNNVDVKIISGDNPDTVSNIARRVGVKFADKSVSLEGLTDEQVIEAAKVFTVFGRVTPEQKAVLVNALKSSGRTVAMTGDGVNDILALRVADCSIAMASGTDATRNASHLVLLDNNFNNMPKVVSEGRRVVNNIQKASSMFFMKTVYTICLMLLVIIANLGLGLAYTYPYSSTQILLLENLVVGIPTVLLAIQPNNEIIRGKFLANVFKRSLPASITFLVATVLVYLYQIAYNVPATPAELYTITAIVYTICGFYALYMAAKPLNNLKAILLMVDALLIFGCIVFFKGFLDYSELNREETLLTISVASVAAPFYLLLYKIFNGFNVNPKLNNNNKKLKC